MIGHLRYIPHMSSSAAERRSRGLVHFNSWLSEYAYDILTNLARRALRSRTSQLEWMLRRAETDRRDAPPPINETPEDPMVDVLRAWPADSDLLSRQLVIGAPDESLDPLRAGIAKLCGRERPSPILVGQVLRRYARKWYGDVRLVSARNGKGFCVWCLEHRTPVLPCPASAPSVE